LNPDKNAPIENQLTADSNQQTLFESIPLNTNLKSIVFLFAIFLSPHLQIAECFSQQQTALVRPIEGSRIVVGDGEVPLYTVDCFLYLCGRATPNIVVLNLDGEARVTAKRFKDRGAETVLTLSEVPKDSKELTLQMLSADGVWIEGTTDLIAKHPLLPSLLKNITKRNGVIAVSSSAVSLLSELDENDKAKLLQSPFSTCEFHFGDAATANNEDSDSHLKLHFTIPNASALVVHQGRRIAGYGNEDVGLMVKESNGWPLQKRTFECIDVFGPGGYPSYSLDLLSWIRSANERGRSIFPPESVETPVVDKGTLFLHGGSRIEQDVMEEFIKLAGGKDAPIVCIPSASQFDPFEEPDSYSARTLREMDCTNVTVLHTDDPFVANTSKTFASKLKNAKAVWIDGGRTFRFMDSYEGTQVPALLAEVLKRGGVVGGSSAGCQVPSDFLVRGNPTSNQDIEFSGYTRGMGLLKGTIIDAHFLQRGRHEPFLELMKKYPQMLGVGIDESTALIVQGQRGRVTGKAAVSFYDLPAAEKGEFKPVILKAGEMYDLKSRKVADE
jgi:cyanophycinase